MTESLASDRPQRTHLTELDLGRVPVFRQVDGHTLQSVEAALTPRMMHAGEIIFREGDAADAFYVVAEGHVRIVSDAISERVALARLGPGQYFGEMALVAGAPRSAAAIADSDGVLLALGADDFSALLQASPALRTAMERVAAHRAAADRMFENEAYDVADLGRAGRVITIGRAAGNDIVLSAPGVAPRHAEIRTDGDALRLVDLGTEAGTYRNREPVREALLEDGDVLWMGTARLFIHDGVLKLFQPSRGVRVDASGIEKVVSGGRAILSGASLVIYPGELVAIVGPSGAGKTTLMNLLLGMDRPTAGSVLFDGLSLYENLDRFRPAIGYVPQQDIVHPELTARESLRNAARLRLPAGMSDAETNARIGEVLQQLHMGEHADLAIGRLSGGQRKRASLAVELLSEPRILFLDEPTSGLDPGLDDQLMHLFREIADRGRTVVLTTHATRNIRICDRVVIVSGGRVVFVGAPEEALRYFEVDDFVALYPLLESSQADAMVSRFAASWAYDRNLGARIAGPLEGSSASAGHSRAGFADARDAARRWTRQFVALLRRDLLVARRDRVTLALRLLGPPILVALLLTTFDHSIFEGKKEDGGSAREAITILYLLAAIALFIGAVTAAPSITREDAIYRRERLVNLSPSAYVLAKSLLVAGFAAIQAATMIAVLGLGIELPGGIDVGLQLFGALFLTSLAGMAMGLFISSVSPNADRAAILAVIAIIPQLIFGGSTVPRSEMGPASRLISELTVSKWSLELTGQITGLDFRIANQRIQTGDFGDFGKFSFPVETPFDNAFKIDPVWRWLVLIGFSAAFLAATLYVQTRKGRASPRAKTRAPAPAMTPITLPLPHEP